MLWWICFSKDIQFVIYVFDYFVGNREEAKQDCLRYSYILNPEFDNRYPWLPYSNPPVSEERLDILDDEAAVHHTICLINAFDSIDELSTSCDDFIDPVLLFKMGAALQAHGEIFGAVYLFDRANRLIRSESFNLYSIIPSKSEQNEFMAHLAFHEGTTLNDAAIRASKKKPTMSENNKDGTLRNPQDHYNLISNKGGEEIISFENSNKKSNSSYQGINFDSPQRNFSTSCHLLNPGGDTKLGETLCLSTSDSDSLFGITNENDESSNSVFGAVKNLAPPSELFARAEGALERALQHWKSNSEGKFAPVAMKQALSTQFALASSYGSSGQINLYESALKNLLTMLNNNSTNGNTYGKVGATPTNTIKNNRASLSFGNVGLKVATLWRLAELSEKKGFFEESILFLEEALILSPDERQITKELLRLKAKK